MNEKVQILQARKRSSGPAKSESCFYWHVIQRLEYRADTSVTKVRLFPCQPKFSNYGVLFMAKRTFP